jgi:hypothetical protein
MPRALKQAAMHRCQHQFFVIWSSNAGLLVAPLRISRKIYVLNWQGFSMSEVKFSFGVTIDSWQGRHVLSVASND